jgi:hypothetical protein
VVIKVDIEICEIAKSGINKVAEKRICWWRIKYESGWVLWPLCVFGCISVVVVEDACVRDCRGLWLCTVGTIG